MSSIVKASLLGGIVLFLWSAVSWMALPFHNKSFKGFTNEDAVIQSMKSGEAGSGVYLLPYAHHNDQARKEMIEAQKWPFVLIVYNREGYGNMGRRMFLALLADMLAAFLAAWLLARSGVAGYKSRVLFIMGLGVFAGLAVNLPNLVWWGFSADFTLLAFLDLVIGWKLAGLVIAKFLK